MTTECSSPSADGMTGEDTTGVERELEGPGQAIVRRKRQTTLPKRPFVEAELRIGDRMRVRADGPGRLVFERIERPETLLDART